MPYTSEWENRSIKYDSYHSKERISHFWCIWLHHIYITSFLTIYLLLDGTSQFQMISGNANPWPILCISQGKYQVLPRLLELTVRFLKLICSTCNKFDQIIYHLRSPFEQHQRTVCTLNWVLAFHTTTVTPQHNFGVSEDKGRNVWILEFEFIYLSVCGHEKAKDT